MFHGSLCVQHISIPGIHADKGWNKHHARTDEITSGAKSAILHSVDVVDKVAQFFFDRLGLRSTGAFLARLIDEVLDFVLEQSLSPTAPPFLIVVMIFAKERLEHFAGMLEGVVKIHDFNAIFETVLAHVFEALGAIDKQDDLGHGPYGGFGPFG